MKLSELTEKQVVHCATEEEAKRICKIAHEQGLKWKNGDIYLEVDEFKCYGEKTCYNFNLNMFGYLDWYKEKGYEIIPSAKITEEPQRKQEQELKKVWAWDFNPEDAFETYLIKELSNFRFKYICVHHLYVRPFEKNDFFISYSYKNISEIDPRTRNEVIKIVEKYGKDYLMTIFEKLD